MNTYEDFVFEEEFSTKDEKKGAKAAKKALKKLDVITKDDIQDLRDAIFKKTTNADYLNGYCGVLDQAISQMVLVA